MNNKKHISGYSLLELLIAMTLGIFVIGATLHFFETTRKTQKVQNELSEIRENAQFALDVIKEDIQMAGFYGCATRWDESSLSNVLNDQDNFKWNFSQALTGSEFSYDDNASPQKSWNPPLDSSILPSLTNNTLWGDTITIRYADRHEFNIVAQSNSTAPIEISSDNDIKQNDYVLATDCEHSSIFQKTNLHNTVAARKNIEHTAVASSASFAGNSSNGIGKRYPDTAKLLKLKSMTYFIKASPEGIPTLYRRNSTRNSEQVISGITDMQIQYGVDSDEDDAIDAYYTANEVETNGWWDNVLIVKLWLKAEGYADGSTTKANFSNHSGIEYELSSAINLRNRLP